MSELAKLTGTEKQIKWAESIRAEKLAELAPLMEKIAAGATEEQKAQAAKAYDGLCGEGRAYFWIDMRNIDAVTLVRSFL
jgi:hypothetical protein